MKAQRFQLGTNTSAVLMSIALQHMASEVDIVDGLTAHEFDGSFVCCRSHFGQVNTSPGDDFDYSMADEEITPTEESWSGETSESMPETGGVELLRWLMEGVKASEIKSKPATWVALKYCCFSAMIHGALFDKSICDEPSQIIGRYSVALESRLSEFGIGSVLFGGLTEAGHQRLNEIKEQESETV